MVAVVEHLEVELVVVLVSHVLGRDADRELEGCAAWRKGKGVRCHIKKGATRQRKRTSKHVAALSRRGIRFREKLDVESRDRHLGRRR